MGTSWVSLVVVAASLGQSGYYQPGAIRQQEVDYQKQAFKQWWGKELSFDLEQLPLEGKVPEFRIPYSGHDYPDSIGGTTQALRKYDQAFHRGRELAANFERQDVGGHRGRGGDVQYVRGLFGRLRARRIGPSTPGWYGHCNGWTAAAIRHAEPTRSVVRNGVEFTPADIKGMLAEIYMYTDSEFLGGIDAAINPATLHVVLTNWLGRGAHPIGMEAALGEVVINYPLYEYTAKVHRLNARQAEVQMTALYAMNTNREFQQSPRTSRKMYFHYVLDLDAEGQITGGRYYGDSARVDMLWAPLKPVQGGKKGNERGNPHLDVKEVLAIWRESVSEEVRSKWLNIDPTKEDRVELPSSEAVADATLPPRAETALPTTAEPAITGTPSESAVSAAAEGRSAPEAGATPADTTPADTTPADTTPADTTPADTTE